MQVPLRITATNIELGPDDEALIQQRVGWLERFYPQLVACIVTLEGPGEHHRKGGPVAVQLELRIPRSEPLLVNRQVAPDLEMALQEAFDAARRRLEDIGRKQRLQIKIHLPRLEGRIAQLLPDADCGFLTADDGHRVYFHRNAVLPPGFAELAVGSDVRFVEEQGAEGPQASTVEVL